VGSQYVLVLHSEGWLCCLVTIPHCEKEQHGLKYFTMLCLDGFFIGTTLTVGEDTGFRSEVMCVDLKVLHSWEELRNACKVLVIKLEGKGPL